MFGRDTDHGRGRLGRLESRWRTGKNEVEENVPEEKAKEETEADDEADEPKIQPEESGKGMRRHIASEEAGRERIATRCWIIGGLLVCKYGGGEAVDKIR